MINLGKNLFFIAEIIDGDPVTEGACLFHDEESAHKAMDKLVLNECKSFCGLFEVSSELMYTMDTVREKRELRGLI